VYAQRETKTENKETEMDRWGQGKGVKEKKKHSENAIKITTNAALCATQIVSMYSSA